MINFGNWIMGGVMALLALGGLYLASRAHDDGIYWAGLGFFLFAVLFIFNLIRTGYDHSEERKAGGHH